MVAAVRRGTAVSRVARTYGVSRPTVRRWVQRAAGQRLDRVDWQDRPSAPHHPHRTDPALEERIVAVRQELHATSDLGEYGAVAIQRELRAHGLTAVPAVRTIGRILERRGALDGRHRLRRRPPPRGWYLPDVATGDADVDSFDMVEGLVIKGGSQVEVLTGIALHSGLPVAWPETAITAPIVLACLVAHWRAWGLPAYAQFDNDTRFQGPHQYPDTLGRVIRLCLSLGVVPVFAPVQEPGFQAAIGSFNGRWQAKVWARFQHASLAALQAQSARYLAAARLRCATRLDAAPARRPFPPDWRLDLQAAPDGRLIFLRRTTDQGTVSLLGHTVAVAAHWPYRLVRCDVDLEAGCIRCFALRRRDPTHQPLLCELPYQFPHRRFDA